MEPSPSFYRPSFQLELVLLNHLPRFQRLSRSARFCIRWENRQEGNCQGAKSKISTSDFRIPGNETKRSMTAPRMLDKPFAIAIHAYELRDQCCCRSECAYKKVIQRPASATLRSGLSSDLRQTLPFAQSHRDTSTAARALRVDPSTPAVGIGLAGDLGTHLSPTKCRCARLSRPHVW